MIEILNRLLPVYDDVNCLVCFYLFSHSFFFLFSMKLRSYCVGCCSVYTLLVYILGGNTPAFAWRKCH